MMEALMSARSDLANELGKGRASRNHKLCNGS